MASVHLMCRQFVLMNGNVATDLFLAVILCEHLCDQFAYCYGLDLANFWLLQLGCVIKAICLILSIFIVALVSKYVMGNSGNQLTFMLQCNSVAICGHFYVLNRKIASFKAEC